MKLLIIVILLSGCSTTKVLVKNCKDLPGSDYKECELVAK